MSDPMDKYNSAYDAEKQERDINGYEPSYIPSQINSLTSPSEIRHWIKLEHPDLMYLVEILDDAVTRTTRFTDVDMKMFKCRLEGKIIIPLLVRNMRNKEKCRVIQALHERFLTIATDAHEGWKGKLGIAASKEIRVTTPEERRNKGLLERWGLR